MNNYGFYLKKLRLIGYGVKNADVSFDIGLNVIVGPSDTGKTFIFQCLDYMTGATKVPKGIPEAKKYTTCLLEIKSYAGKSYTLERSLRGGDFKLYETDIENRDNPQFLKSKNQGNGKSLSDFLLKICNVENKKIRKNGNGEKQNLYFQDLKRYFLIDEQRIIEENTPICSKQYTALTFEQNVFKFLLTEQDDSSIIALLKADDIVNKKGKIEMLDEIIATLKSSLQHDVNKTEIEKQITQIDDAIKSFRKNYSLTKETFIQYEAEKNQLYSELLDKESRINTLNELLKRSTILEKQYDSDIARLKATFEVSQSIKDIETINCPICSTELKSQNTVDIESITQASKKEIEKIILLKNELKESVKLFNIENSLLIEERSSTSINYNNIIKLIKNEVNKNLSAIESQMNKFIHKKSELSKLEIILTELEKYEIQKAKIEKIIQDNKELKKNCNFEKLSTALLSDFSEIMYSILSIIKFDNLSKSISFSEDDLDFVIAEKNRKDFGKGFRAILYAIFSITLLKYLASKPYRIGFALIDTPFNPYKPGESSEGKISRDLAVNCYNFLHDHVKDQQVIVIENTEVPRNLHTKINLIKFSKGNGFLPV